MLWVSLALYLDAKYPQSVALAGSLKLVGE